MTEKNIFKVTYTPAPAGSHPSSESEEAAYVVIDTWESLVDYIHQCRGTLISAESVSCFPGGRTQVLVAPDSYNQSSG